jgi:hypothetical protein
MSRQFGRALDTFVPLNRAMKLTGFADNLTARPLAVSMIARDKRASCDYYIPGEKPTSRERCDYTENVGLPPIHRILEAGSYSHAPRWIAS